MPRAKKGRELDHIGAVHLVRAAAIRIPPVNGSHHGNRSSVWHRGVGMREEWYRAPED
jgi:hypothetical protein